MRLNIATIEKLKNSVTGRNFKKPIKGCHIFLQKRKKEMRAFRDFSMNNLQGERSIHSNFCHVKI